MYKIRCQRYNFDRMRLSTTNRLIALLTLIGFLVGAFGPAVPRAMASEHCAMMVTSPAADDGQPAKGMMPICSERLSCIIAVALPMPFEPLAAHFAWAPVLYAVPAKALSGLAVAPEVSPPITRI